MIKVNLKNIVISLIGVLMILNLNSRYGKYRNTLHIRSELIENREQLKSKINDLISEKEKLKEKIRSDYAQIQVLTEKLSILSLKNEADFKKIIYVFTKESGLKMKEISKSEKLWERNGYKLKYIHFVLDGGLSDFGKFLYYINKSRIFIDTSKMYIDLTESAFKISLGFIERKENDMITEN
ncbi:MAG: hypothetical protein Q4D53_03920 [Leptotrichiaceae bacterium]|nr:hypothetical protein [Leptotrichiaceae bacterium]